MAQAGWTVKHHQADNGRFSDNGFIDAINQKYQKINFCGVGAHHQNGIVKNQNKILTTGARALLIHGMRIWLFSMKYIVERLNSLQIYQKGRTTESILYWVTVEDITVKSFHTIFIPIYVLDARLQNDGGEGPPKWEPRSRIVV